MVVAGAGADSRSARAPSVVPLLTTKALLNAGAKIGILGRFEAAFFGYGLPTFPMAE